MPNRTLFRSVCGVLLLACVAAAPATADPIDKSVLFTFSAPVTLPGKTLPPGQYLFRIPGVSSAHDVVQVLSADGMTHYGFFFAIPAVRTAVPDDPELRFMEARSSMPNAIRAWWYPGDNTGFEFIYPKTQRERLTNAN